MSELTLVIGSKNYSSWSLRPWLAMKVAGIPFREVKILLDQPDTREKIAQWSPSGRIPVLLDGDLQVWDSLAICEYLAERFPDAGLWPKNPARRAMARSISAEMHSGFPALRRDLFMDVRARRTREWGADTQADLDRICEIWRTCRKQVSPTDGPFLFGNFTIADAMYAPVASRFRTWTVPLDEVCAAYRDTILQLPAMRAWDEEATSEPGHSKYR